MSTKAEEIGIIIKEQIKNYKSRIEMNETGTVVFVGDGIAGVYGIRDCMSSELLEFEDGSFGMWEETGRWMNEAIQLGAAKGYGYGQSLANFIEFDKIQHKRRRAFTKEL